MNTPHYSRIKENPETINAITGRSIYYGMRPWRCDDRFQDWLKSFTLLDSLGVQYAQLRTLYECAWSDPGKEPLDNYIRLGRSEVMYYVERYKSKMMRVGMWETYPYDQNAVRRIAEEDGVKMRVWRHQKELELESKSSKVDDAIHENIFSKKEK
ncbi:hypothetical protein AGDE_12169 [Angomonas deanei]|nr:hypothetical protein AGDE_12169 [Angomonas deanei]|eukprot:EPY24793.1 hypothetical protein AGDE_12169 [Angomonas deanei]